MKNKEVEARIKKSIERGFADLRAREQHAAQSIVDLMETAKIREETRAAQARENLPAIDIFDTALDKQRKAEAIAQKYVRSKQ
jgi:hypothetical protein